MRSEPPEKAPALNIRIKASQRRLIERAAQVSNKTVSDFVRDAAIHEAEGTLLDLTKIQLSEEDWDRFTAALDAAPGLNPRLEDLLSRKAPWER